MAKANGRAAAAERGPRDREGGERAEPHGRVRAPAPASANGNESADKDRDELGKLYREVAIAGHAAERRAWLRTQLLAWWATVEAQIAAVQKELEAPGGALCEAFTADERLRLHQNLESAWGELAGHGPACVPEFLTVTPAFFPKGEATK